MTERKEIFNNAAEMLKQIGLHVTAVDDKRPWGGFFVIDENQAAQFAAHFFPEENFDELKITQKLSPKILLVAPRQRLSWQYHRRRAEIWKCIGNDVAVITSDTDEETEKNILHKGEIIRLSQGRRHRLAGLGAWGMVAEIWQHTDASNPSDEDDIVRLQDDYSRK